jgi:hypothetical protein
MKEETKANVSICLYFKAMKRPAKSKQSPAKHKVISKLAR